MQRSCYYSTITKTLNHNLYIKHHYLVDVWFIALTFSLFLNHDSCNSVSIFNEEANFGSITIITLISNGITIRVLKIRHCRFQRFNFF